MYSIGFKKKLTKLKPIFSWPLELTLGPSKYFEPLIVIKWGFHSKDPSMPVIYSCILPILCRWNVSRKTLTSQERRLLKTFKINGKHINRSAFVRGILQAQSNLKLFTIIDNLRVIYILVGSLIAMICFYCLFHIIYS